MSTVTIQKAEVSINVLRIGGKQITKMVWNQIPEGNAIWFLANIDSPGVTVHGHVCVPTGDESGWATGWLLMSSDSKPYKVRTGYNIKQHEERLKNPYHFTSTSDTHFWKAVADLDAIRLARNVPQIYIGS